MILRSDPALGFAVIVAVERSGVFADDPLVGPVRDALNWYDALLSWGLKAERIRLFVSAQPASQPALDDWCRKTAQPLPPEPSEAAFRSFIIEQLPKQAANGDDAALFVIWSGHGLINQRESGRTRRLFYSDSTPDIALNLELVSFMKALRSSPFDGFAQQLLVVDACANYSVGFSGGKRLLDPTDFVVKGADKAIEQRVLLAAAPGEIAQSMAGATARESAALFFHHLLNSLVAPAAGGYPDFRQGFRKAREAVLLHGVNAVDWCDAVPDDVLPGSELQLLGDLASTALVAALAGIDDQLLADAFLAALGDIESTATHRQALDDRSLMAAVLGETPRLPDQPPALHRWAAQIECRLDDPARQPELQVWLKRFADPAGQLPAYRERCRVERQAALADGRDLFLLIVEPDGMGSADSEISGWLFAGQPPVVRALGDDAAALRVSADGSGRATALKTLIDDAMLTAQELGIESPELIIEYALPAARVDEDLENLQFGAPGLERTLGTRYFVLRRLADRLAALGRKRGRTSEIVEWITAAQRLSERFTRNGLHIVWIDPQRIRDGLLPQHLAQSPNGSCVGLERAAPCRGLAAELKASIFIDALPFACWSDDPWSDADTDQLHRDLAAAGAGHALHKLWQLRESAGFKDHPSARLRLLWDDPSHNPYDQQLKARPT